MRQFKILVLTHHSGHSPENSLYPLLDQMSLDDRFVAIDVASRSTTANYDFFYEYSYKEIHVSRVSKGFKYITSDDLFWTNTIKRNALDYDIIFLRLPRPISDQFLISINELFKDKIVINHPLGIIKSSNKSFLLNFPEVCPPMRLCHSIDEVLSFSQKFDIVLKPLKEYGGRGLVKITGDILNDGIENWNTKCYLNNLESTLSKEGYLAMKYLKKVNEGDKRILVVNGEILAASLRLPKKGSWLCNVAQGGSSINSGITIKERAIIKKLNPHLLKLGILMYGVDTLVDDSGLRILSEINTLSVGGFGQAERQTGKPILKITINKIIEYADAK